VKSTCSGDVVQIFYIILFIVSIHIYAFPVPHSVVANGSRWLYLWYFESFDPRRQGKCGNDPFVCPHSALLMGEEGKSL
jgi:hypothetical protein